MGKKVSWSSVIVSGLAVAIAMWLGLQAWLIFLFMTGLNLSKDTETTVLSYFAGTALVSLLLVGVDLLPLGQTGSSLLTVLGTMVLVWLFEYLSFVKQDFHMFALFFGGIAIFALGVASILSILGCIFIAVGLWGLGIILKRLGVTYKILTNNKK